MCASVCNPHHKINPFFIVLFAPHDQCVKQYVATHYSVGGFSGLKVGKCFLVDLLISGRGITGSGGIGGAGPAGGVGVGSTGEPPARKSPIHIGYGTGGGSGAG